MNLLIGTCVNYTWKEIKNWALSAKKYCCDETQIKLIAFNLPKEAAHKLSELGIELIAFSGIQKLNIVVDRFLLLHHYLESEGGKTFDVVLTTDVKDVVFQANPFIGTTFAPLTLASEKIEYENETWGNENMKISFPYIYEKMKGKLIYCAGVIMGQRYELSQLCLKIYMLSESNTRCKNPDQAALNVQIHLFDQPFERNDSWCIHAGTIADPSKIDEYRERIIANTQYNLEDLADPLTLLPELVLTEGVVDHNNQLFPIVHQADRVPEWKEFFDAKYSGD